VHKIVAMALLLGVSLSGVALAPAQPEPMVAGEVRPAELMPLASWQKQFKITEGKDRGKLVPLVFENAPGREQRWRLMFGDYASMIMRKDATGAIVMERLDLLKNRIYVVYEPALPILPRDVGSKLSIRQHANFKIYDLQDGKLKRAGRVTHVVKQISYSQLHTPAGLIDGYSVDIEHGMQMQYARLNIALRLGCRLDDGPVYGAGRYTLRMLGLFSETRSAAAGLAAATQLERRLDHHEKKDRDERDKRRPAERSPKRVVAREALR
jgi:hypothetical protein